MWVLDMASVHGGSAPPPPIGLRVWGFMYVWNVENWVDLILVDMTSVYVSHLTAPTRLAVGFMSK